MFLAAGPYFHSRFESNKTILKYFQSSELFIANLTNLTTTIVLTKMQAKARYSRRIIVALLITCVAFTLLAVSTRVKDVSAGAYFGFLLVIVLFASLAGSTCQNGTFALVAGYGQPEYTQGIMTGQAVAGVLPCIAQIVSVLSVPPKGVEQTRPKESSTSTFASFLTAVVIAVIALVAVLYLISRHPTLGRARVIDSADATSVADISERKTVRLTTLFSKLYWLCLAVALTFGVTMAFPVFTQRILSVNPSDNASRILEPASFIPLAFLVWNTGDLIGRVLTGVPALRLSSRPKLVFVLAVLRMVFIPMYFLCNIGGKGAKIPSDFFYLFIVQLFFGISNGYIGSTCMMGAAEWVDEDEREAAGGFMVLCLITGLTIGSVLSFLIGSS